MDLGRKSPEAPGTLASPSSVKEPKVSYPGFSLSDKVADEFNKAHKPALGDEYTATIRLKVTSLSADEYSNRVQFDAVDLDDIADAGAEEKKKSDDDEAEKSDEKVLGFSFKRKKSEKEAPDISAKTLED
jgi:hypothetical protein